VRLRIDESLRIFLPSRARDGELAVCHDGTSTVGHHVQSAGVPLTEVGLLLVDGRPVEPAYRELAGAVVDVRPVERPERPTGWPRFVLDVHLGALARRLRLLGIDTAYSTDAGDDELVERASSGDRLLLTKDRGILRRRAAWRHAAYVRGQHTDEQVDDVLDRFRPPLAPYTRCTSCNGEVRHVARAEVVDRLEPGTARSYQSFARCLRCDQVYWRGAHATRLDALVGVHQRPSPDLPYAGPL
jgi:uncharacterized protein with PIN domain